MAYKAQACQNLHAAQCKVLGVAYGKGAGKLQNQIGTGFKRRSGSYRGLMYRRHPPLGETAAHQANNACIRQLTADQLKLPLMPPVKGVIFTNNTCNGF